jgi:hypothetical protein
MNESVEYLKGRIQELVVQVERLKQNEPFHNEISANFEAALGPNPRYPDGGCWIVRAMELREERDRLRAFSISGKS